MALRQEFVVGVGAEIEIAVDAGRVVVVNGDTDRIVVDIDGRTDDWQLVQTGSTVTCRPEHRRRARSARIEAVVPAGCRVAVTTASADVRLDGQFGPTRVKTASGDVQLGRPAGLRVSTASGDVRAADVDGDCELATVSGDARIGAVAGRVSVTTTSGDIDIDRVAGDLGATTVSGDVRIGRFDGDDLAVKSVAGDLDVGLPTGVRVSPEISTFSGATRLPEPRPGHDDAPRRRVRLAFRSVSGDLTIRRVEVAP